MANRKLESTEGLSKTIKCSINPVCDLFFWLLFCTLETNQQVSDIPLNVAYPFQMGEFMAKYLAISGTTDDAAFLVHENIHITEATGDKEKGSTSVFYSFQGFVEEKPRTREEKKAKVPATVGPVVMSKRAFSDVFSVMESIGETVKDMDYNKLIRLSEKKLAAGLSLYITEQQAKLDQEQNEDPEDKKTPEFFRGVLSEIQERIVDLNKNKSTADPEADVKRRFCKAGKYLDIRVSADPSKLVIKDIQAEIDSLETLKKKAAEVTKEDYIAFLEKKFQENGLDEDNIVMLRNTSEKEVPAAPASK